MIWFAKFGMGRPPKATFAVAKTTKGYAILQQPITNSRRTDFKLSCEFP
jgi:hypothetical protein